jgi:hypothetical protein
LGNEAREIAVSAKEVNNYFSLFLGGFAALTYFSGNGGAKFWKKFKIFHKGPQTAQPNALTIRLRCATAWQAKSEWRMPNQVIRRLPRT